MKKEIVTSSPSGVMRKLLQMPSIKKYSALLNFPIEVNSVPFFTSTYVTKALIFSNDLIDIEDIELMIGLILSSIFFIHLQANSWHF